MKFILTEAEWHRILLDATKLEHGLGYPDYMWLRNAPALKPWSHGICDGCPLSQLGLLDEAASYMGGGTIDRAVFNFFEARDGSAPRHGVDTIEVAA